MASLAAAQYIPPDRYGDEHKGTDVVRKNTGQVFDTQGNPCPSVMATFENTPAGIYLRDSSRVSFTYVALHNDSVTPDSTYRLDMDFLSASPKQPDLLVPAPGVANYYRGNHAAEHVPAYYRGVYTDVLPHIDYHAYGTARGPRMAFVIRPGGDPSNIKLRFTGQDSLGIDWQGALKVYLSNKWIELKEAIAYQVDDDGNMTDVPWTANYELSDGNAYAYFNFAGFNRNEPLVLQIGVGPAQMGGQELDERNLDWSTYMGGTGGDALTCVKTDDQGNPYACGYTWAPDFPVDPGNAAFPPFQPDAAGYDNAVVMKFSGTNRQLMWATYYGGSTASSSGNFAKTVAHKLAVQRSAIGNMQYVFVTGSTNCTDFTPWAEPTSLFVNAVHESYLGGLHRMWAGAFRKHDGTRDWATTHGEMDTYSTYEEGLSIAYDKEGGLAVGGRQYKDFGPSPVFQPVTPSGAYQQEEGGGFVMLFNADFTIRWSTAFLGYHGPHPYCQVADLLFTDQHTLWLTGSNEGDYPGFQPSIPPNNGFNGSGNAFLASFDVPTLHLDYFTGWGIGLATIGYGLDYDGKQLWMVGGTQAPELSPEESPNPGGTGVYHNTVNSDIGASFGASDGFILAFNPETYALNYGTLFGGGYYDMLLAVTHDEQHVYITGESRSATGSPFVADLGPDWYYQDLNPNWTTRDALVIALNKSPTSPKLIWSTAFGGIKSERGWGIAASSDEVYLVGATASNFWEGFPLKEYDPVDPDDFYQDHNNGGESSWFMPLYSFVAGLDFEGNVKFAAESQSQIQDAFIASFRTTFPVGIMEQATEQPGLTVTNLPAYGLWEVHLPSTGNWTLRAYDAAGKAAGMWRPKGSSLVIDLRDRAQGLYLLRATTPAGAVRSAKIIRP